MKSRKTFLAALGMTGIAFAFAQQSDAAAPIATHESASPASAPPSPPAKKTPTAVALAIAATMRRFDAKLTDAQIETIARGIDDSATAAASLNPKKKRLRNGDEPVTAFTVRLG